MLILHLLQNFQWSTLCEGIDDSTAFEVDFVHEQIGLNGLKLHYFAVSEAEVSEFGGAFDEAVLQNYCDRSRNNSRDVAQVGLCGFVQLGSTECLLYLIVTVCSIMDHR